MANESASALSSKAIIAEYTLQLEQATGLEWVNQLSVLFQSNQASEIYKWLGQVPTLREWVGGRLAKSLSTEGITISNIDFESTLEIAVKELTRVNSEQFRIRISEQVRRSETHWATLMTALILAGPSSVCYDGQFFFDTDHSEGSSGTQSNDISVDISALPVAVHGTVTAPSVEEMADSIHLGIQQIISFVDNEGEPMNEEANAFTVMVPTALLKAAQASVTTIVFAGGVTNALRESGYQVKVVANPRLTWTDSFAVFRTDSQIAPFIRQEETPVEVSAQAEGSPLEFNERKHQYGLFASRNVGYGRWQYAVYITMV